jgi:hypothetical protein
MRVRFAGLVAVVLGLCAVGAHAAPAPNSYWLAATVVASGGTVTLKDPNGVVYNVAADTNFEMTALLNDRAGNNLLLWVEDEKGGVKVDYVLAENPANHNVKIQGATDDDGAIGYVKKHKLVLVSGETTAEEEAGGQLYYDIPVTGGGLSADKNTGYTLAVDLKIVQF